MTDKSDGIHEKHKHSYAVVPKKLIRAWIASMVCMIIMTGASVQWAYYIDERSNRRWCGIVNLFNQAYKENPPPTEVGRKISKEMLIIRDKFHCE